MSLVTSSVLILLAIGFVAFSISIAPSFFIIFRASTFLIIILLAHILASLDLSRNDLSLENLVFVMLVQNLTTLRKLALDQVNISLVSPKSFANLSSSLTNLNIYFCSLRGIFPDNVFRLPNLTTLDISNNLNLSGILPRSNWTSPLKFLSLRDTSFSGEIPNSIGTFKSLTYLDLRECNFTGHVPSSLANLEQLQNLYIGENSFSRVVEFEIFAKLKNLRVLYVSQELNLTFSTLKHTFLKLEELHLPFCNLTKFPYFLHSLKRLTYLNLSFNRIRISHDTLETLVLSENLLEGGIQLLHWKKLSIIYLEDNSFQGPLPILPLSTVEFVASDNHFTGEIPSLICQSSSLQYLSLSNNTLFGNMPSCFGNITNLMCLDLSSNKLQGPLPCSLVKCMNLLMLVLGHNEFNDIFPLWLRAEQLSYLDLQSNKFHGRINLTAFGLSFPALQFLVISNNNFIGWWPTKVFSNTSLAIIDLSNNEFGGPIPLPSPVTFYYAIGSGLPQCLTNFSIVLSVLNLQMNDLEGTIPQLFSSRSSLTTLDLSQNRFEGTLPRLLVKCRYLEVLDFGDNQIEDTFPKWLGTLPELKVLILRSNNLKDLLIIPRGAHLFPKLHILDLSNNNFSGPLSANLLMSLRAMVISENGQDKSLYMTRYLGENSTRLKLYENSVTLTVKGQEIELVKILTFLKMVDLSCNSFQGHIPGVIGHLHSLVGLSLSHNHFTGSIPPTLGNLTNLEWLDLSSNKLSGAIPRKLGDLAFLEYLNLSKNQLTGRIPRDKQLSTFSNDSFSGNPSICGTPLPKTCPSNAQSPPPLSSSTFDRGGNESWFKDKTIWLGYASGIVVGFSIAYIAFEMGKPKWLMRVVQMLERRAAEWMEKLKGKAIKFHGQ
ncbi:hypothetical protein BT93_J0174 [Corymbia citriodora subsp. variegata]|nr:hypothetical protein BT93_J0174 [Corymbia citriodora subsp. variegata]